MHEGLTFPANSLFGDCRLGATFLNVVMWIVCAKCLTPTHNAGVHIRQGQTKPLWLLLK